MTHPSCPLSRCTNFFVRSRARVKKPGFKSKQVQVRDAQCHRLRSAALSVPSLAPSRTSPCSSLRAYLPRLEATGDRPPASSGAWSGFAIFTLHLRNVITASVWEHWAILRRARQSRVGVVVCVCVCFKGGSRTSPLCFHQLHAEQATVPWSGHREGRLALNHLGVPMWLRSVLQTSRAV